MNDMSAPADTGLPGTDVGAEGGVVHCQIEVEVSENQYRRLAPEFQRLVSEIPPGMRARTAAGLRSAGQDELVDTPALQSALPVLAPRPVTMLNTPSGSPASVNISASRSVVSGVSSDGLTTVVQPEATTAAKLLQRIINGWLKGVQLPTTPTGPAGVGEIIAFDRNHGVPA